MHGEHQFTLNQLFEQALEYHQSRDYVNAFEGFKEVADKGDPAAAYYVGVYYENGIGVSRDLKLAFQYYQWAASYDEPLAQYKVGFSIKYGRGVEQSYKEAIKYLKLAAVVNLPEAFHEIADCYLRGIGVEESWQEALSYYDLALKLGYEPSRRQQQFLLNLFRQKDHADIGDPEAQAAIGFEYCHGFNVKRSYDKAYEYLKRAADQGHLKALYELGGLYLYGKGVTQSNEIATCYLQEAAYRGFILAIRELHQCFENGLEGLKQDCSRAINYYRSAADKGIAIAFFALGECYLFGRGVEVSWIEATNHYKIALENGYKPSQDKLVYIDHLILLQDQADHGNIEAQLLIAKEHQSGKRVQKGIY